MRVFLNRTAVVLLTALLLVSCSDGEQGNGNPNPGTTGDAAGIRITGVTNIAAGECRRIDVQVVDKNGNPTTKRVGTNSNFEITPAGSAQIFSNSVCTTAASAFTLDATGAGTFFFKDSVSETVIVKVTMSSSSCSWGCSPLVGSATVTVVGGAPAALVVAGVGTHQIRTCVPLQLQLKDAANNSAGPHSVVSVTLAVSGLSATSFFSDAACTTSISSVNIPSSVNSQPVYVQSETIGTATLEASAVGLASSSVSETFVSGATPKLAFVIPSGNIVSNACVPVRVESQRADGSPLVRQSSSLNVGLQTVSGNSVSWFQDSGCLTGLVPLQTTIAMGSFFQTVYLKTTVAPQTVSIAANTAEYISASGNLNFIPVPPSQVAISGTPTNLPAGSCGIGLLNLLDLNGNPAFVSNNTTVNLSVASNITETDFFSGSSCSGVAVTSLIIPQCVGGGACVNTLPFSFRPKKVGVANLAAASTGLSGSSASVIVDIPSGSAQAVTLSSTVLQPVAGQCIPVAAQTKDGFGNFVNVSPALVLNLSSASTSNNGMFFSDVNCTNLVSNTTIPLGTHDGVFYFKNTAAETTVITAAGTPTPSGQLTVVTRAAPVQKLAFLNMVNTLPAGACSAAFTIQEQDQFGNATTTALSIALAATNGALFYSNASCTTVVSTASIAPGSNQTLPLYFASPNMGSATLQASSPSLASAVQLVNVTAMPDTHLLLSCSSNPSANPACPTYTAGDCIRVYAHELDSLNQPYLPIGSTVTVNLSSSSTNPSVFYTNSSCNTLLPNSQLTISNNPTSLFVRNTLAENFSIGGTPSIGAAGSLSLTTNPGTANRFFISPSIGASTILTQVCAGPYNVALQDVFGNAAVASSSLMLSFASSSLNNGGVPAGTFFSDNSCSSQGFTIGTGSGSLNFYVKSAVAGGLNIFTTASGILTPGTRSITIQDRASLAYTVGGVAASGLNYGNITVGTTSPAGMITVKNISSVDSATLSSIVIPSPYVRISSGSTCIAGTVLSPNQTCNVVVAFAPTATGVQNGVITFSFNSTLDSTLRTSEFNLTGTGVATILQQPFLSFSSVNYGALQVGTSSSVTATLQNLNSQSISISSINGISAPYSVNFQSPCSNTVPFTMTANSSCPVQITFAPTVAGSYNTSFTVTSPTAGTSNAMALSGSGTGTGGTATTLTITPQSYSFGTVSVGSSSGPVNFTLRNTGSLSASNISLSNYSSPFSISMGTCGTSLAAGAQCTFSATFSPTATASFSAAVRLQFTSNGGNVTVNNALALSGTANTQSAANLVFDITSITFSNVQVGTFYGRYVLVTNTGSTTATNMAINTANDYWSKGFYAYMNSCGTTLAPNTSCFIDIGFAPFVSGSVSSTVGMTYRSGTINLSTSNIFVSGSAYY